MSKAIVLYLHAHQPYRLRHYTVFDAAARHDYFNTDDETDFNNRDILSKVATKSYGPTNQKLIKLLNENPDFKVNLSISGLLCEQLEQWSPEILDSFKELVGTGQVEIAGETYYHSLAFFYDRAEFERQVAMHKAKIEELFGQTPTVFRNTELAYNNELAAWAEQA